MNHKDFPNLSLTEEACGKSNRSKSPSNDDGEGFKASRSGIDSESSVKRQVNPGSVVDAEKIWVHFHLCFCVVYPFHFCISGSQIIFSEEIVLCSFFLTCSLNFAIRSSTFVPSGPCSSLTSYGRISLMVMSSASGLRFWNVSRLIPARLAACSSMSKCVFLMSMYASIWAGHRSRKLGILLGWVRGSRLRVLCMFPRVSFRSWVVCLIIVPLFW